EILHHDIDAGGERLCQFEIGRLLQVEHEAFLATVVQREQRAFAVLERTDMAVVVACRWFELDDLGTEIGEQRRAVRSRKDTRQVENPDAGKRATHAFSSGARATSFSRMAPSVTRRAAAFFSA